MARRIQQHNFIPQIHNNFEFVVSEESAAIIRRRLREGGIDDDFIENCRKQVTEGTSALFLMCTDAVEDRVLPAMKEHEPEVLWTNLSIEQEQTLREAFEE